MESDQLPVLTEDAPPDKHPEEATMGSLLDTVEHYRTLKHGEVVEGTVVRINQDEILVDIGAKTEGIIRVQEGSEGLASSLSAGSKILVYVVVPENREGNAVLSLARAQAERDWRLAQQMHDEGSTFDGEVIGFNKGGLIVRFGEVRGFVPASQVVELRSGDREQLEARLSRMIGRKLKLKIIELDRTRNRLILSEKAAHREWRTEMRDRLLTELKEGETRRGRVTSLCDFGAFVDLGGIDGLVHISELAWRSVAHPSEVLQVGADVDVIVLGVDREKRRVALSIKRTMPEPWLEAVSALAPGQTLTATISKLVAFGAFARITEGVEGLIHISELANERIAHPKQVVQVGDTVLVRILNIEPSRRRLSLSLRQAGQADDSGHLASYSSPAEYAPPAGTVEPEPLEAAAGGQDDEPAPEPETGAGPGPDAEPVQTPPPSLAVGGAAAEDLLPDADTGA